MTEEETTMTEKEEEILVLFGSQRGTSEDAARAFAKEAPQRLNVKVKIVEMDDFLESPSWRTVVVIFVSSFGTGGAPMGAQAFRKFCDRVITDYTDNQDKDGFLKGIYIAMCGQGDSKYQTYQENPKTIVKALTMAGAELVGDVGATDAENRMKQQEEIRQWIETIWDPLSKVLADAPLAEDRLQEMNMNTK
jgi:sulfite reductase alpha subunit-like flavoprotein